MTLDETKPCVSCQALHRPVEPARDAVEAVWQILNQRGVLVYDDLGAILVKAATPHLRAQWEAEAL